SIIGWQKAGDTTWATTQALGGLSLAQTNVLSPAAFPLTWSLTGRAMVQAGTYTVRVAVSDGTDATNVDVTIIVKLEDAFIEYSGDSFVNTATANTPNATINATAVVREAGAAGAPATTPADSTSTLGDKLNTTQLRFT